MRKCFFISLTLVCVNAFAHTDSTWDLQGQVLHPTQIIHGPITIKHAVIEKDSFTQVFDTLVNLQDCKTREFSTAWFGAKSSISDNSVYLQKCITTCISNNISNLYCADNYSYSKSLLAYNLYQGIYVGFGLNFYGEGDFWNQKQTLTYTGTEFAYGVQVAKGGSVRRLCFKGPGINYAAGIVIDYDNTKNQSGSTGFTVEDCIVDNFRANYYVSPKQAPYNGDNLVFHNIHSGRCFTAFLCVQPQNKGVTIDGFYSWDTCQTAFYILNANVEISHVRIAGYCNNLLNANVSGWNTFSLADVFAESLNSLGTISAFSSTYQPPINLQNLNVRFNPGSQTVFTSNSSKVRISNSALWVYTGQCCLDMKFIGPMIFDNCDFGRGNLIAPQAMFIIPVKPIEYP